MDYYLETNSLRQLVSKVDNPVLTDIAFTSILALIEIASGIKDESSFKIRKTIIDKILTSKLTIYLNLPETLFLRAFGFHLDDNAIVTGIGRILFLMTKSDSFSNFNSEVKNSKSKKYYDFILNYDRNGSILFKDFYINLIDTVRVNPGFNELIRLYNSRWSSKDEVFALDLYNSLIDYFSRNLWKSKIKFSYKDQRTIDDIKASYDHSVDIFIVMATTYSDQHISFGNIPGTNDFFDLCHLMYLDNVSKKIVTNDKLLHKLLINSFSKLIFSTIDFRNINNI